MKKFEKSQIREFIKDNNFNNADDVQKALKDLFAEMLKAELDDSLGYSKNDKKNTAT